MFLHLFHYHSVNVLQGLVNHVERDEQIKFENTKVEKKRAFSFCIIQAKCFQITE